MNSNFLNEINPRLKNILIVSGCGYIGIFIISLISKIGFLDGIEIFLFFFIYCLPLTIGYYKDRINKDGIGVLNLLWGWTIIGWILALLWSFSTIVISKSTQAISQIFVILFGLFISLLSLHISEYGIFPKDNLTFNHTFISSEEVNNLIEKYNNCNNVFEQQALRNEPLYKKLVEKGVIFNKKEHKENDIFESEKYNNSSENKQFDKSQNSEAENIIRKLISAEDNRNLNEISECFASNIKRYWDLNNIYIEDLKLRYNKMWQKKRYSKNEIINMALLN